MENSEASEQSEAQALRVKSAQAERGPGGVNQAFHPFTGEQHHHGGVLLQLCFDIEMEIVSFCCWAFGFVGYLISPSL